MIDNCVSEDRLRLALYGRTIVSVDYDECIDDQGNELLVMVLDNGQIVEIRSKCMVVDLLEQRQCGE